MTPTYHDYAPFYDGSGQMRFAVLVAQYLAELLQHHPVHGRRALDLACGTGTLALQLADNNWDVVGVDASDSMLAIARSKAAALDTPGSVQFVRGDMRDLGRLEAGGGRLVPEQASSLQPLASKFSLVTCTYDSLNYLLTEDDLAACFANVAQALAPGGLFIADMNTRHFLEHDWEPTIVIERLGFVEVAQSHFDPTSDCSAMALTGFVGDDEHGYQRFDELHVERAYPPETVARLLAKAGLHVEAAYDCFTLQPYYDTSQRIAWIARKVERASAEYL